MHQPIAGDLQCGLAYTHGFVVGRSLRLTAMALVRRNEFVAAMAVLVVVPIHKCGNPLAGLLFVAEWPAGVIRPVFNVAEQRFQVGIVVAHPRTGEGSDYPQFH